MASSAGTGKAPAPTGGGTPAPSRRGSSWFGKGSAAAGSGFDAVSTRKGSAQHEAAGFVLGVFVWCWVVLPFLDGGPTAVKNTLRAKFINEGADGKPL